MDTQRIKAQMVAKAYRFNRKRVDLLTSGYSERLSRLLSSEKSEGYWYRSAAIRTAQVSTSVHTPYYYPGGNIYRHKIYVLFNSKGNWLGHQLSAGTMAYTRQSAARFSLAGKQARKKLSSFNRSAGRSDNLDRIPMGVSKRAKCPHKLRLVERSDGHPSFYCQFCGCKWSDICAYRRLHPTEPERAVINGGNPPIQIDARDKSGRSYDTVRVRKLRVRKAQDKELKSPSVARSLEQRLQRGQQVPKKRHSAD